MSRRNAGDVSFLSKLPSHFQLQKPVLISQKNNWSTSLTDIPRLEKYQFDFF